MADAEDHNQNDNDDYERLNELAKKDELTQEKLQAELQAYSAALREEYETKSQATPENVEEYTREFFKKNVHAAAAQIVYLSHSAESESIRLRAAQTVVTEALKDARAEGDPIKSILAGLSANDGHRKQEATLENKAE